MCTLTVQQILQTLDARDLLDLVREISARRGVVVDQLCGRVRTRSVSWARQEVWWRMRHHPERFYSLLEIAQLFGRNHATVKAGIEAHGRRLRHADEANQS